MAQRLGKSLQPVWVSGHDVGVVGGRHVRHRLIWNVLHRRTGQASQGQVGIGGQQAARRLDVLLPDVQLENVNIYDLSNQERTKKPSS